MAWFKIDDELPKNRKARAVRKSHPDKRRDVAPFGIWALAGAWSSDGFVALEVLEDWDDDAEALADRLVRANLWHRVTRDGEPGYVFHDWPDHNPTRDDSDPSVTGTFGNHVRWHVQRKIVEPDCAHCPSEPSADIGADVGGDIATIGGESLPSRPVPTRPDPTRAPSRAVARATEPPESFDEFWDTYSHKVGRKKAVSAYRSALKKPGVTADSLLAAARAYIAWQVSEGKHPTYTKHPATWLNGEHWRDERVPTAPRRTNLASHMTLVQQLAAEEAGEPTLPQLGGAS